MVVFTLGGVCFLHGDYLTLIFLFVLLVFYYNNLIWI